MRLHGLLAWYDEPPTALAACIAGLHKAGVDHVIALDGAYLLYPGGHPASPADQAATIERTCEALGIGCTIHTPQSVWQGNEVEKRTAMFSLARSLSEPGDWWMIMDADQVITAAPSDLKARLEQTDLDVADVTFWERRDLDTTAVQARQFNWPREHHWTIRILFRAQPLHCQTNHYTYVTRDGRVLWCSDSAKQEPCLDLTDLKVEHRHQQRPIDRQQAKVTYYQRRDTTGAERGICQYPGCEEQAVRHVGHDFRLTIGDDIGYTADLIEVCAKHKKRVDYENRWQLEQLGVDPDTAYAELRDG